MITPKVVNRLYQAQAIQNRVMQPHEARSVAGDFAASVRANLAAMRLAFLVALLAVMALISGAALAFLVAEYLEPPSAAQVTAP